MLKMGRRISCILSLLLSLLQGNAAFLLPTTSSRSSSSPVLPVTPTTAAAASFTCLMKLGASNNKNNNIENNNSDEDDQETTRDSIDEDEDDDNEGSPSNNEPIRTIGGGADMIFEMARQMLLWDETEDTLLPSSSADNSASASAMPFQQQSPSNSITTTTGTSTSEATPITRSPIQSSSSSTSSVLPRWHAVLGVSDSNPSFRTAAPRMNSQGYSGTIWRNCRKANKPSLWRHSLRTYDRMGDKPPQAVLKNTASSYLSSLATTKSGDGSPSSNISQQQQSVVQRTNIHHEGALVAAAKLGLWTKALQIYQSVSKQQQTTSQQYTKTVFVTDNMILSLIRSCVLASRTTTVSSATTTTNSETKTVATPTTPTATKTTTMEIRRAPLDACLEVLLQMEDMHNLPLVARHLNPLAAAYSTLGLTQDASRLLEANLSDRTSGPEEENGYDPFNVNDVRAKDKGSYALLVKGAVSDGNWEGAVDALKTMTEAGLYPNARHLNGWTEVSERKTKQRTTRSWKKKRDEYWLESVR